MKINDRQDIEELFHVALTLDGEARAKYLSLACDGKQLLRAEVESLLASFEKEIDFLEQPAFSLGMKVLGNGRETSLTGQQIGFYKILEKLGSGGMGEVYLAEDTKLNRRVALKFLSGALVNDNWAKKQLVKEAQAVAMLDHPNICPVYGFEEIGEHSFIVMQWIEGKTLSELIREGAIDAEQILPMTQQITCALAAAHARGIIHRDIKTGNIMVTPTEQIKVLDFGLAKIIKRQKAGDFSQAASVASQNGLVVGTVAYMSPEQLRAEKLDYRTDVFSLGTVFYELVSGKHPFLEKSDAETISAILTKEFEPLPKSKNGVAATAFPVIKKCLEKDKHKRYRSANELLLDLQRLPEKGSSKTKLTTRLSLLIALVFISILIILGAFLYQSATRTRTLAVLPFVNNTGDAENNYMSTMAETLIYKISNSSQISVKPLTMVANYTGNEVNPVEVGRNLNVDAVLTGRMTRRGEQIVLEVKLINIYDGNALLNKDEPLNESNTLTIQDRLSEQIVARLQSPVSDNNKKIQPTRYTQSPEANDYYLKGLYYWRNRNNENIKKAIDNFNQALKIDPEFAQAYAYLAQIYLVRPSVNYKPMNPFEARKLAQSYAEDALRIDENLSEAHAALAAIRHKFDWNWTEAEKEYRRSIELNPEVAQTYYSYSELLSLTGRHKEAIEKSLKARELDPFAPLMDLQVGRALYYARRFKEADKELTDALEKYPNNPHLKSILGFVYLEEEKGVEALKIFKELHALDKQSYAASLGYAYGRLGKKAEALNILNELEEIETQVDFLSAHETALIYIGLDDKRNAFRWLDKAYDERFIGLPLLSVNPIYENLRTDERFQDLLSRMNLNKIS
jgi:eukaryotic-like serine/threonine-protein kinase